MAESAKSLSQVQLQSLFDLLTQKGYELYGPVWREHAVMYERITSVGDLPAGIYDEQSPGSYRFEQRNDGRLFAHTTSPDSWKRFLFPKEDVLYSVEQQDGDLIFKTATLKPVKKAFIGIRSCDLHAIAIQDRVFLEGEFVDDHYASRRSDLLFVAVNCTRAVDTCFCASLDCGPAVSNGYDIALTEIPADAEAWEFTAQADSEAGCKLLSDLQAPEATAAQVAAAKAGVEGAAAQSKSLPVENLKQTIYDNFSHDEFWAELGQRCLHCANCTLVCPTCFCSSVEEQTDLSGDTHERVRHWDSCFNSSHSYIAGGSIREEPSGRYRQWFSHKLASWQDQFDTLGCSGCGRCITWCPVGIDITQEAHNLQKLGTQFVEGDND